MFLRTTRGSRSTCRFSAVVSWLELLIDFGSGIFFFFQNVLEKSNMGVACFHIHRWSLHSFLICCSELFLGNCLFFFLTVNISVSILDLL